MYVITEETAYSCCICTAEHYCSHHFCTKCDHKAYEYAIVFFEPQMPELDAKAHIAKAINKSITWLNEKVNLPERLEVSAFMLPSTTEQVWNPPFDAHMIVWSHEVGDEMVRDFTHRQNCLKSHCLVEPYYDWLKVVQEGLIRITVIARRGDLGYMCPSVILDPMPVEDLSDREDACLLKHNIECAGISRYGKFASSALEQVEAAKRFVFRSEQEIPLFYTHWTEMMGLDINDETHSETGDEDEEVGADEEKTASTNTLH